MGRTAQQRVVTIALEVLRTGAYASRTHRTDTMEVRLAVAALWLILGDRAPLRAYWARAQRASEVVWDTNHHNFDLVAAALRREGWHAPVDSVT